MFEELTMSEQLETEGGGVGTVLLVVAGVIFICGAVKGCSSEAAK